MSGLNALRGRSSHCARPARIPCLNVVRTTALRSHNAVSDKLQHQSLLAPAVAPPKEVISPTCGISAQPAVPASGSAACDQTSVNLTLSLAVALIACSLISDPAAAADSMQHQSVQPMLDLAEGEEFWGNVAKYGRYFVTVMLGTGYVMAQPLIAAFKRPTTAVLALLGVGGTVVLLKFVLNAMLGLQEPFDYEPGSIVPYN